LYIEKRTKHRNIDHARKQLRGAEFKRTEQYDFFPQSRGGKQQVMIVLF